VSGSRSGDSGYRRIYRVVRRIPVGKVATYGQIAMLAGIPRQPRQVGYALHALPEGSDVPWQRVINAKGEVSPRSVPGVEHLQRAVLESEGIVFDGRGRVDLARHQWRPR
jgi:methylated-DNA-protein-cysteine methyltransferase-like protein